MKKNLVQLLMLLIFILGTLSCKNETREIKVVEPNPTKAVFKNSKDLVSEAKKEIKQILPEQLKPKLQDSGFYIIDVREKEEYVEGNIPESILIPRGFLEFKIGKEAFWEDKDEKMPSKDQKIVVYCKSGGRGSLATKSLKQMGYTNVVNLEGGFLNWEATYPNEISVVKDEVK